MEIVEGHCFGERFSEGFVAKDIIKKTLNQWQMSFTHIYEHTCISYIKRLKKLTTQDHEIHHQ
jgi:hypothetical protein